MCPEWKMSLGVQGELYHRKKKKVIAFWGKFNCFHSPVFP